MRVLEFIASSASGLLQLIRVQNSLVPLVSEQRKSGFSGRKSQSPAYSVEKLAFFRKLVTPDNLKQSKLMFLLGYVPAGTPKVR
jgi:hypothetical protein